MNLRIDTPTLFGDIDSLEEIIKSLRSDYPVLHKWHFGNASQAWDNTIIEFHNIQKNDSDLRRECLNIDGGHITFNFKVSPTYVDFRQLIDCVAGGLTESFPSLVKPVNNHYISDVAFHYMGMYLLSSLVRYRPQIWVHSVSRFSNSDRPADDQALSLIEKFMSSVQIIFPNLVAKLLTQP